jgi:hypothetical protein
MKPFMLNNQIVVQIQIYLVKAIFVHKRFKITVQCAWRKILFLGHLQNRYCREQKILVVNVISKFGG